MVTSQSIVSFSLLHGHQVLELAPAPQRRKIRIALELREQHILDIMKAADFPLSKAELGGLLRRPGTRQYKPCGEQLLRNFLFGLGKMRRSRGPVAPPTE